MGANFTGITFDGFNVSPSDDGLINRTILPDGILSGCGISYSGSTLTMASGTLIACGRQFRHPAAQNWAVVDATTGYARLLITLDLTRSATEQAFDQVVDAVEYANDISGFPALVQQDLNAAGTKYQIVACVVSLGTGGISGIINTMPTVRPASADGGTLTVTAPGGSTVTVSKDGKTLTRVAGADGIVVFRGLETGTWTLTITNGSETASKTVEIVADYATSITFFAATIHITYPAGSTCTVTDGTTTLVAPDTSGTWACVVPNAGTWTVSITNNAGTKSKSVAITSNGQTESCVLGAPSAYQEVVYLQSTGTQYINPNLTGKTYRFRVNTKASIAEVVGRLYGDDYSPYNMIFYGDGSSITPICTYNGAAFGSKMTAGTVYTLDRTCSDSGIVTVKNGNTTLATYDASSVGFDNSKTRSPYIFCYNSQGTPKRYAKANLYWMTIYDVDGTTKLREFVPCYRKSDSVAGLYDLVNGVFYTNAGSGTFVVGGNV